jgi:hypothetical protein
MARHPEVWGGGRQDTHSQSTQCKQKQRLAFLIGDDYRIIKRHEAENGHLDVGSTY